MNETIGLVLSGGGVRALAHIGLIKALSEEGIVPDEISGTSAGALVAALYAYGYTPEEMLNFFKQTPLFKFSLYTFRKPGLIDSTKFHSHFLKFFPNDSFEELKCPTYITATNLLSGQLEIFSKGQLIRPLIASSAIPPYFSPIKIKDQYFADGGIINNLPIQPLQKNCKKIIGSFVNPLVPINKDQINTTLKLLYRVYHIGSDIHDVSRFPECNYIFSPKELTSIGIFETRSIEKAFETGYLQAVKNMDQIKKNILS